MKEDKKLDKFIQEGLEVENTPLNFSNKVMKQIDVLEFENEKGLISLIQKCTLEKPSVDFTSNVLSEIYSNAKPSVYQPVISKKIWYVIAIVILSLFVYVFYNVEATPLDLSIIKTSVLKLENMFSFNLPNVLTSPIFALSIFALSALLFLDYFLQKRKIHHI